MCIHVSFCLNIVLPIFQFISGTRMDYKQLETTMTTALQLETIFIHSILYLFTASSMSPSIFYLGLRVPACMEVLRFRFLDVDMV